jgi:cobalamin biosynthesis Mg chelatase CobN
MSAVFRKGGDVTFLVEELKAVFDPRGGYFKAGGVYMPSIVAELGAIIEQHLKSIGLMHDPELEPEQRKLIAEKRAAYEARVSRDSSKKKSERNLDKINAAISNTLSGDLAGVLGETARKTSSAASGSSSAASGSSSAASGSSSASPGSSPSPLTGEGRGEGEADAEASAFPPGATMCNKCNTNAVILMDGCATCLNCGYSKCG